MQDEPSSPTPVNVADMTYATVYSAPDYDEPPKRSVPARRPPPKRNLAAKKKHDLQISQIIDTQLPLEYRGGDIVRVHPSLADVQDSRLHMEQVIGKLMDSDEGCASEYR